MKTFRQIRKEWSKDPAFQKAYDELDFEYKIIDALVIARMKRKLTQKQLADKIGVAQSALARFESGRINPRLSFLRKVTHGLGLTLSVK